MKRRIVSILALVCASLAPVGCESMKEARRDKHASEPLDDSPAPKKFQGVKAEGTKDFFQPSRLPGGLSSESRDIERSLGVN